VTQLPNEGHVAFFLINTLDAALGRDVSVAGFNGRGSTRSGSVWTLCAPLNQTVIEMSGELFIQDREEQSLEAFGTLLFEILNVKVAEVRDSDNVAGGRYLIGMACGLRLRLELADNTDFSSYDFLLSFEPLIRESGSGSLSLDSFADIVAKHLARKGLAVARPLAFGTINTASIEYKPQDGQQLE
jgi:hypothetical protein